MRKVCSIILVISAGVLSSMAEQAGVPAKMTILGKDTSANVFLQSVSGNRLLFQLNRRPSNIPGPIDKIAYLEFLADLDVNQVVAKYNQADYEQFVRAIDRSLDAKTDDYWQFMCVRNNYRKLFLRLMEAYYKTGDYDRAAIAAAVFVNSDNEVYSDKGRSISLRIALVKEDYETAEKILEEVISPAGKLYLTACIQQAKGEYKASIWTVSDLLKQYANDLEWVPMAELLCAKSYRKWAGDDIEPYMDSAIFTARQVKSMHPDTGCGGEAEKLQQQWIIEKDAAVAERTAKEEALKEQEEALTARLSGASESESAEEADASSAE